MSHRTFRSLDEPPKLIGFSIRQWAALIAGGLAELGLVQLAALPLKAAITLAVFTLGLPAALMYVSEAGGLRIGLLLRDALRWRLAPKHLASETEVGPRPGDTPVTPAARGNARRRWGRRA